jgi:DNA polymerase elongation subunit (family B)
MTVLSAYILEEIIASPHVSTMDKKVLMESEPNELECKRIYDTYRRGQCRAEEARRVAILDMETDPFDNVSRTLVKPFHCTIYFNDEEYRQFWNDDAEELFYDVRAFLACQAPAIIYAHNGGKFDYKFIAAMLDGAMIYNNGRIYKCKLRNMEHELRDSWPLIPVALANLHKEKFDYANMASDRRHNFKKEIEEYCLSDCVYLMQFIKRVHAKWGSDVLTIGQVAWKQLSAIYPVEKVSPTIDGKLRPYFHGGFCGLLRGPGVFKGRFRVWDVNSMYPHVMCDFFHPIGKTYTRREKGPVRANTWFIDLVAPCNAFLDICRVPLDEQVSLPGSSRFRVGVHEYDMAIRLGRIDANNHTIRACIDNDNSSDFSNFVTSLYKERYVYKTTVALLEREGRIGSSAWYDAKANEQMTKLLLNNAYGKLAQDPENFLDYSVKVTDYWPPDILVGEHQYSLGNGKVLSIKESPPEREPTYYNVGTAASITSAARAILMQAIQWSVNPIYCDTDSIINEGFKALHPLHLNDLELGGWKFEAETGEVAIAGKKLYSYYTVLDELKLHAKGANILDLTHAHIVSLANGDKDYIENVSKAPCLKWDGQEYLLREIRKTGTKSRFMD